jgi:hypothetical protein
MACAFFNGIAYLPVVAAVIARSTGTPRLAMDLAALLLKKPARFRLQKPCLETKSKASKRLPQTTRSGPQPRPEYL